MKSMWGEVAAGLAAHLCRTAGAGRTPVLDGAVPSRAPPKEPIQLRRSRPLFCAYVLLLSTFELLQLCYGQFNGLVCVLFGRAVCGG